MWIDNATDVQDETGLIWSFWASLFLQIRQAYDLADYNDVENARRKIEESAFRLSQYDLRRWWEMVTRLEKIHTIVFTNLGKGLAKVASRIVDGKESCVSNMDQFRLKIFMSDRDYDGMNISKAQVVELKTKLHSFLPRKISTGVHDNARPAGPSPQPGLSVSEMYKDICRYGPNCKRNALGTCPKPNHNKDYSQILCLKIAKGETCSQSTGCPYGHDISKFKKVARRNKPPRYVMKTEESPSAAAHAEDTQVPTVAAAEAAKGNGKGGNARPPQFLDCRMHTTGNICSFAEKCKFKHDDSLRKIHAEKRAAGTLPVCAVFQKTGNCRFGDGCRFSHAPVAPKQT